MDKTDAPSFKKSLYHVLELIVVLLIAFGIFIYSSTRALLDNFEAPTIQDYNSFDFYFIVLYEVFVLAIIIFILKKRKWKLHDFNLDFKMNMLIIALLLIALRYATSYLLNQGLLISKLLPTGSIPETEITLSTGGISIVLMLIVNSVFEELILIGYLFKKLERFPVTLVILFSIIIRVSIHTYQGLEEIPRVIALGLVLGLYYSKYKKLWPVILAHGIGNLIVFLNYEYHWFNL